MKTWTEDEIQRLKKHYNKITNAELQMLFPNKTFLSIYKKAYKLGLRKDKTISFLNRSISKRKPKKSVIVDAKGYKHVYLPEHPRAHKGGRVMEHIVVWERANGKYVPDGYCVHHINGDKGDNRIENLCLMTISEHTAFHNTRRKLSNDSKQKIRKKAIQRFRDKRNHPLYKNIDVLQMQQEIARGNTVKSVCEKYHINRVTYYKKLKEGDYKNA